MDFEEFFSLRDAASSPERTDGLFTKHEVKLVGQQPNFFGVFMYREESTEFH